MRSVVFALVALLGLGAPSVAVAQAQCDISLFRTQVQSSVRDYSYAFYLALVTRDNYQEAQQAAGASYQEAGVDFSGNWEQFSASRDRYFERTQFNSWRQYARDYATSYIDAAGADAYQTCLQSGRQVSLHSWLEGPRDGELVSVNVRFRKDIDLPPRNLELAFFNAVLVRDGAEHRTRYVVENFTEGTATFTFRRDLTREFRLTINMPGVDSESVFAMPPAPQRQRRLVRHEIQATGIHSANWDPNCEPGQPCQPGTRFFIPVPEVRARDGGRIVPGSARFVVEPRPADTSNPSYWPNCWGRAEPVYSSNSVRFSGDYLSVNRGQQCYVRWTLTAQEEVQVEALVFPQPGG